MKQKKYDYVGRRGFNIGGCKFLENDYVKIVTYDGEVYHGRIQAIFDWAFGNRQGIAVDLFANNGDLISLDDAEIHSMQWLG